MKLRLTQLYEDYRYETLSTEIDGESIKINKVKGWCVMARLVLQDNEDSERCSISVPAEMVGGAKVGDSFTLHLERVKE